MALNQSLQYMEMMARELAEIAKADDRETLEYIFRMAAEEAAWLLAAQDAKRLTGSANQESSLRPHH